MEELKILKEKIVYECEKYVYCNRVDLISPTKDLLPDIQRFVMNFIESRDIGVEEDVKQSMNADLLSAFNEIADAMEHDDSVLMFDALYCGIVDYLRLFVPEEEDAEQYI